jgi:hypothetical protein
MLINHNENSLQEYQDFCKNKPELPESQIKILDLIWGLIRVLFRHGNQEIYYHICGGNYDTWDVPIEAEGIGVRMTNMGKKVTLW